MILLGLDLLKNLIKINLIFHYTIYILLFMILLVKHF